MSARRPAFTAARTSASARTSRAALAVAGAVVAALPAQAAVPVQRLELQARVAAVRAALATPADDAPAGALAEGRLVAQATNWTNWPKWSKWSNWANK